MPRIHAKNLPMMVPVQIMRAMNLRSFSMHAAFRCLVGLLALMSMGLEGSAAAQSAPRVRVLLARPGAHLNALVPNARAVFFDEMREMGLLPLPTDGGCEDLACAQQLLGLETADVALLMTEEGGNVLLTLVGETEHHATCADREEGGLRACLRELVRGAGIPVRAAAPRSAEANPTTTAQAADALVLTPATSTASSDATPSWILGTSLTLGGVAAIVIGVIGLAMGPSCVDSTCLQYERSAELPSIAWIGTGAALVVAGSVFFGVAASTGGTSGSSARATFWLHF